MKLAILTTALLFSPLGINAQTDAMPTASTDPPKAPAHDSMPMKAPVPPSKSVTVTFQGRVTTLTVEDLLKLPQVTVHVHNAHRNADETYAGPLLSDVLAKAGLTASKETEPLILHSSVVATGTDKYYVLYSVAEVEPSFSKGQVIVAVTKGNELPDTEGGVIQIINTTDAKPARWLHGLTQLNVVSDESELGREVSEPAENPTLQDCSPIGDEKSVYRDLLLVCTSADSWAFSRPAAGIMSSLSVQTDHCVIQSKPIWRIWARFAGASLGRALTHIARQFMQPDGPHIR